MCRRLLEDADTQVAVIDDLSTGFRENLDGLDVDFVQGSVLDEEALNQAVEGADAIVHLAALGSVPRSVLNPIASHEANATGTLMVLEAARRQGNAHVVLASSSSVYGANKQIPKAEDMVCMPMSPYAVSKLATEQYAMAFAECYDLPVLPFRFFNVYGPGQRAGHAYAAVVPMFVDSALRGDPLRINGDGHQSRDFTYVGTVTEVIADAIGRKVRASCPTNLAFGSRTTLLDLVSRIEVILGNDLEVVHGPDRPGDVKHSQADNSRLREMFPEVTAVELPTGLVETIEWFRSVRTTARLQTGE